MSITPQQKQHDVQHLWVSLEGYKPDFIVCEDFEFRQGQQRRGLVLFSVQLIGVARLWCEMNKVPISLQRAAQGKSYYDDKKLKEMGLYVKALKHGNDATRHLLHWFTFGSGYQFNEETEYKLNPIALLK